MVDRKCENCRYFRRDNVEPTVPKDVWGDCTKPREHSGDAQDEEAWTFFTWTDSSCDNYEPAEGGLTREP
jgi:hypothetical protein